MRPPRRMSNILCFYYAYVVWSPLVIEQVPKLFKILFEKFKIPTRTRQFWPATNQAHLPPPLRLVVIAIIHIASIDPYFMENKTQTECRPTQLELNYFRGYM